jgi:hypothetical protein
MSNQFHSLTGLTAQERDASNVREFTGDGTPYLKVPGLKSVSYVRVGGTVVPLEHEQAFPNPDDLRATVTETEKLIDLQFDAQKTPILLRSKQSNHGLWQAGVPVFVGGEWSDDKRAFGSSKPEPTASGQGA